jgi:hypothetical protein
MITITNITKGTKGIQKYLLKVNDKEICTFEHNRDRGLVVLLKEAAGAVLEKERNKN